MVCLRMNTKTKDTTCHTGLSFVFPVQTLTLILQDWNSLGLHSSRVGMLLWSTRQIVNIVIGDEISSIAEMLSTVIGSSLPTKNHFPQQVGSNQPIICILLKAASGDGEEQDLNGAENEGKNKIGGNTANFFKLSFLRYSLHLIKFPILNYCSMSVNKCTLSFSLENTTTFKA